MVSEDDQANGRCPFYQSPSATRTSTQFTQSQPVRRGGAAFRPPSQTSNPLQGRATACWRCGRTNHSPNDCPAKTWYCFQCHVKGHTIRCFGALQSRGSTVTNRNHHVKVASDNDVEAEADKLVRFARSQERTVFRTTLKFLMALLQLT